MTTENDLFKPIDYRLWRDQPTAFAQALGASFRETGFAVVNHHPIDQTILDAGLSASKAFFALPEAVKRAYFVQGLHGQRGYTPFKTEVAKGAVAHDLKEFWHVGRDLPKDHRFSALMPPNLSVREVPNWTPATQGMFQALDDFGGSLLSAIAIDLGLDPHFFADTVKDGNSILRLLHYPPQLEPAPEGSVRAGAHEDINVITLLLGAEEGGLEVRHRRGVWLPVNPPPGSLVVNIGDMLARLTNDILPSTSHRVVNPKPERAAFPRYSTPYFLHFRPDFEIRTLASAISADRPDRYPQPLTAQAFLFQRLKEIGLLM